MSKQQLIKHFFRGIISLGYISPRSVNIFTHLVEYKNLQTSFDSAIFAIVKIFKNLKKNKNEAKEHKF